MEKQYLGDGLYASYDGYQVTLKANSETNPTDTVYLDPHVLFALLNFIKRIQGSDAEEEH
jgi:hypothetical protein